MEDTPSDLCLLTATQFENAFGISEAFIELCFTCGLPSNGGTINLRQLNFWLSENYSAVRRKGALKKEDLPHRTTAQAAAVKAIRVQRDYYVKNRLRLTNLPWSRWLTSIKDSLRHAISIPENSLWPDERIHRNKPFTTLLEDAAWAAVQSLETSLIANPEGRRNFKTLESGDAHLSILSTTLFLEAAANCALDTLAPRGRTTDDIEQLPTLGKFDVYLLSRGNGATLNRGDKLIQSVLDLIHVRNNLVHPKIHVRYEFNTVGTGYNWETPRSKILDIPLNRWLTELKTPHAKLALEAALDFLNYFFLGLCEHTFEEVTHILFDSGEMPDGTFRHYLYQRTADLVKLEEDWNLDFRFLHTYKSRSKRDDGRDYISLPCYSGPGSPRWTDWVEVQRT